MSESRKIETIAAAAEPKDRTMAANSRFQRDGGATISAGACDGTSDILCPLALLEKCRMGVAFLEVDFGLVTMRQSTTCVKREIRCEVLLQCWLCLHVCKAPSLGSRTVAPSEARPHAWPATTRPILRNWKNQQSLKATQGGLHTKTRLQQKKLGQLPR